MKLEKTTLDKLPLNKKGIIKNLHCNGNIRRRLLDLGLVTNTSISPVFISASGDPTAFEVRGTIIAIRKNDSSLIDILF